MSTPIVNKYIKKLHDKLNVESENFFYIFRGQPNADEYKLDCSASRNFDESEKSNKGLLADKQGKLISDLKIRGFSKENQRELHDLELLADLRHYGTPSCLIDFTSNFLTALWFACENSKDKEKEEKEKNKNGKVFILNCYETDKFSVVSSEKIEKDIEYFFDEKFSRLWYWIPERLNQRLTDQDAVFVFGRPEITNFQYIEVDKEDKKEIHKELEKFFDYTKKTLFSDKYALGEIYKNFGEDDEGYWESCLEEAVYYIQTGKFQKAKERLNKIKPQKNLMSREKKLLLEVHFQCAFADMENIKIKLKNKEENRINITNLASEHLKALKNKDQTKSYIKDFAVCTSANYKKEKIEQIKKEFEHILDGLQPPEKEDGTTAQDKR